MAILNTNEMMFTAFEPKLQNRFLMYIDGIPAFIVKKVGKDWKVLGLRLYGRYDLPKGGVDRADALRNLTEALGGKLLSFYGMIGQHYHVMAISEVPEYANLSAGIVTAMMANTLEDYKVIPLYESSDITKVSAMYKEVMSSYKKPGN